MKDHQEISDLTKSRIIDVSGDKIKQQEKRSIAKRSESADFSDHMVIRPQNYGRASNKQVFLSSQSDLYSPQRKFDLDLDPNNRATGHKFHPSNQQEKLTSHTITPLDGGIS